MDKKKIFLVSLGHLSCDINGGALPAILPFLITAYGFDYQAAAGLMFAFSCLSSIIQPAFGYLSDKLSKPWFIPVGVLLAGGGLASIGFLHDARRENPPRSGVITPKKLVLHILK